MQLTDTHTHLFLLEFDADRPAMMQRAIDKGVTKCFLPNIDVSTVSALLKTCDEFPLNCFPMMGLHPCSVNANYEQQLAEIKEWFDKRKFYAVGEIGIDLYHDVSFAGQQKKAFRTQVEWAKEMNLPIIIHCRNSFNEVMDIITEMLDDKLTGIFHCFSGNAEEAQRVMDLKSFKMGIGGVVTYKNSTLPQVLSGIPLSYIILETDSPYLTPVPYRGKRNESSYTRYVADKLSEVYHLPIDKIAEVTTQNAIEVFGKF
jgi:TatD DNase family protein